MLHGCEITTFSLSSSLLLSSLLCFALLWSSSTLGLGLCTPPSSPSFALLVPVSTSSSFFPLLLPSPPPSVVYQDGFYGAADLYVSNFYSRTTRHICPSRHAYGFLLWGDSACACSHALHRAACRVVKHMVRPTKPSFIKHGRDFWQSPPAGIKHLPICFHM